jgi:hypothetical protein
MAGFSGGGKLGRGAPNPQKGLTRSRTGANARESVGDGIGKSPLFIFRNGRGL